MKDPWRFVAFPVASVTGYLISLAASDPVSAAAGLTPLASEIAVIGVTGFVAGFMVDEVIPAYLEKVRSSRGGGSGDMDFGGGGDDDLNFE